MIGGCIIEDSKNKETCNYLIITTAPNETIVQYLQVLDCLQLQEFHVILLNGKNKKPQFTNKNIIVCSKQFLQTKLEKTKHIIWLNQMKFEMRFIDESHNGGTTELAQKTLDFYGNEAFTIQITATYSKPIHDYNIPKENWILWDLEDIQLCKNGNIKQIILKHGYETIINQFNIMKEYSNYPDLWLLTDELKPEIVKEIINETRENKYGWSTDACFLLKQGINKEKEIQIKEEFQNEEETLKLWYRIFGKKNKFGIPDSDTQVFLKRIEKICKNSIINSRFIGDTIEPVIIMAFLPQNNIDKISNATIQLLQKQNVIPDYEIISINSKTTNNPKQTIENTRIQAKNKNKKGVLVLSGKQCSLGVSIENCDIVLLLNNNMSFDMIYQMMFRCMTEGVNKKCGFVVDLNIHRVIDTTILNYASLIQPENHPKEAIQYILQEKLITLNGDHWMPCFGNDISKITTLSENVYQIYTSRTEIALNHFLDRLRFKHILLTKDEQHIFNALFCYKQPTQEQEKQIKKLLKKEETIQKGIDKTKVETTQETDIKINYMELLKHMIPLICLFTIHEKETSFIEMFHWIENNKIIYEILIGQTQSWWGKNMDSNILKQFLNVYIKYIKEDKETNQIIRVVKELFQKNINNSQELSKIIDTYLIPQELEKKKNAEVSTPRKLRQEMLDKIPINFWINTQKVFEPCCGKGGFLVDIIERFMNGLESKFPDEKERYRIIVETCLYWSDINPTNIFICKLLLDPYNEYQLNYNEGDTLKLNIKEKWNINGFDAVIGNPPYNSTGNTGTGNTIWQYFTKQSLQYWLKTNGYLVFVHPPGWRKPNTDKGKFTELFYQMTKENQMLFLSIHGIKDGLKTFHCGTRYDWYIIQKCIKDKNTIIQDENKNKIIINMSDFTWLPNSNIDKIQILLAKDGEETCEIIYSANSYETRKKWISKIQNDEFKYPVIHTIPQTGIRYIYSKLNNKGHFGISKVIFGQTNTKNPILDINGIYAMSEHSMAIQIDNKEEGEQIIKTLQSDTFQGILNSCLWSNFMIDWRLFTYFKKQFWKLI